MRIWENGPFVFWVCFTEDPRDPGPVYGRHSKEMGSLRYTIHYQDLDHSDF